MLNKSPTPPPPYTKDSIRIAVEAAIQLLPRGIGSSITSLVNNVQENDREEALMHWRHMLIHRIDKIVDAVNEHGLDIKLLKEITGVHEERINSLENPQKIIKCIRHDDFNARIGITAFEFRILSGLQCGFSFIIRKEFLPSYLETLVGTSERYSNIIRTVAPLETTSNSWYIVGDNNAQLNQQQSAYIVFKNGFPTPDQIGFGLAPIAGTRTMNEYIIDSEVVIYDI